MFDSQDLQQARTTSTEPPLTSSGVTASAHPLDRLAALFRHRKLAATAFMLVVVALMLQTYSTVPLYRTSSQVLIQDERTTAVGNLNSNDPMFWQESDQVLQHAVQHSAQPRARQARRSAAESSESPAVQWFDARRPRTAAARSRSEARGVRRSAAGHRRLARSPG